MEQVVKSEPSEQGERPDGEGPLVFLDANVIRGFLQGDPSTEQLVSAEADGRIRFAVNPIVLQGLLLGGDAARPEFERISDRLHVLPLELAKAEAVLAEVRALRNDLAGPYEIMILSSAGECDFLVTRDARLKNSVTAEKPQVVTPEELVTHLRAA